jgi:hypothetical protein
MSHLAQLRDPLGLPLTLRDRVGTGLDRLAQLSGRRERDVVVLGPAYQVEQFAQVRLQFSQRVRFSRRASTAPTLSMPQPRLARHRASASRDASRFSISGRATGYVNPNWHVWNIQGCQSIIDVFQFKRYELTWQSRVLSDEFPSAFQGHYQHIDTVAIDVTLRAG